jgi:hypothetical protein
MTVYLGLDQWEERAGIYCACVTTGLMRLQELLKSPTQTDIKIVVRQLNFLDGNR